MYCTVVPNSQKAVVTKSLNPGISISMICTKASFFVECVIVFLPVHKDRDGFLTFISMKGLDNRLFMNASRMHWYRDSDRYCHTLLQIHSLTSRIWKVSKMSINLISFYNLKCLMVLVMVLCCRRGASYIILHCILLTC